MFVLMTELSSALAGWESSAGLDTSRTVAILQIAERLLESGETADNQTWHEYLDITGRPRFLKSLPDRAHRDRWAQTTFRTILRSGYSIQTMFEQRVERCPNRVYLQETRGSESWTYAQIARRLRLIAAMFCSVHPDGQPRVAIFSGNRIEGACCDLACLIHGIPVSPLNIRFDVSTLVWIFDRLGINVAVTDTEERFRQLAAVRAKCSRHFPIFVAGPCDPSASLDAALARQAPAEADRILAARPRRKLNETATVMFTSGSTGMPKGVAFTEYNILTKRFARAAALPDVGEDERLLCYLPLYHTFGRYLELLGMLYWRGTYVFAADDSEQTLLRQLSEVRPTGLISVPIRWSQIRDAGLEKMKEASETERAAELFRTVVGDSLRWGISAAGFLDPRVFHFFQRNGVELCSGFGMTEATGGVTMTPPGEYVDNTVGIPLPGVKMRFRSSGELEIAAPYVARYLDEAGPEQVQDPDEEYWLATGDIFRIHAGGHLEIVDRAKDIYKNSRGQTVPPRKVEQRFDDVPGIKRVFLVGDGRDYNVLLIVPDSSDQMIASAGDEERREYFTKIVAAANSDLPPQERIVDFAVLSRDFQVEKEELTPKGSFRRKVIEEHFAAVIGKLYSGIPVEMSVSGFTVRIPRWFFTDFGVLESDIVVTEHGLRNRGTGQMLRLEPGSEPGTVFLGDLEYSITGRQVDLGLFAHQPRLWVGNPSLVGFCPCRARWELPMGSASGRIRLPRRRAGQAGPIGWPNPALVREPRLRRVNRLSAQALFGPSAIALRAVRHLAVHLRHLDSRVSGVIRSRLEALARHSEEDVRCLAYEVLLLDEPAPDYSRVFPAFVESGLRFLNEKSIEEIAGSTFDHRRLEALRQRLASYRSQLPWPAGEATRAQFEDIFRLLAQFVRLHREYFAPVRAELSSWVLHRADPELSRSAENILADVSQWFEKSLTAESVAAARAHRDSRVVFEDGISSSEARRLETILADPAFLRESVMLAFDEDSYNLHEVPAQGIWVSRILSQHQFQLYRLAINLRTGEHFDLLLAVGEGYGTRAVQETVYWLVALSGRNWGTPALPKFGAFRRDLGAMSLAYVNDLTAWDKIREFSSAAAVLPDAVPVRFGWRKLFIRAIAAFFGLWRDSGFRILPGAITPANVAVPEADFQEGTRVLSLTGWRLYEGPLSLVEPLAQNFYRYPVGHYPKCRDYLDTTWIFDACIEALGMEAARKFFAEVQNELAGRDMKMLGQRLSETLAAYVEALGSRPYLPLPLLCAVDRFSAWDASNSDATPGAREDTVNQVYRLYRLDRFPEPIRYYLYRRTYFARADSRIQNAFDRLLSRLAGAVAGPVSHLEELSDLQAELHESADREVFSRMVFPQAQTAQHMEVLALGSADRKRVIVRSQISDTQGKGYVAREAVSPSEIGYLYRLFLDAGFPNPVYERESYLIAVDEQERIIGGACYAVQNDETVYLDGLVVTNSLKGRGIAGAILEDLCVRLAGQGFKVLKTNFFLRRFYNQHNFHVDSRWPGLIRFL